MKREVRKKKSAETENLRQALDNERKLSRNKIGVCQGPTAMGAAKKERSNVRMQKKGHSNQSTTTSKIQEINPSMLVEIGIFV